MPIFGHAEMLENSCGRSLKHRTCRDSYEHRNARLPRSAWLCRRVINMSAHFAQTRAHAMCNTACRASNLVARKSYSPTGLQTLILSSTRMFRVSSADASAAHPCLQASPPWRGDLAVQHSAEACSRPARLRILALDLMLRCECQRQARLLTCAKRVQHQYRCAHIHPLRGSWLAPPQTSHL